jgi:hypothetical protein
MMKRSLGQKFFFTIFCTFGRYVTNLRDTFVENVKKSKINPPYCTAFTMSETAQPPTFKSSTRASGRMISTWYPASKYESFAAKKD